MSEQNKKVAEEFVQALFTRGELEAVDVYLAPEFVDHNPTIPGETGDRNSMRSASEISRAAVPDWKSKVEDIIAVDDKVVERFTSRGLTRANWCRSIHRAHCDAGRHQHLSPSGWQDHRALGVLDQLALMQQLGAIPGET